MTTHKLNPGWNISYGKRRAAAARAQAHDVLQSARSTQEATARPVERLPFASDVKAPTGNGFYWTYEESVFDGAGMKYFIRNKAGHALFAADTEAEANDMVYRFNTPDKYPHIEVPF